MTARTSPTSVATTVCKTQSPKSEESSKVAKGTQEWGRALMARQPEAKQVDDQEVYMAPLDNGSTSTGFPTADWFVEETFEDTQGVGTEAIDGRIVKPEKKGLGVFRLGNPATGKYILLSMPDSYLQPTYTDPVIAQRKLGKLPNISISMKDKEDDPHQPYMIKYNGVEFTRLFPAKDELYYCSIMKASAEEKAQALEAWKGNKALYASQKSKEKLTKAMCHDRYDHPRGQSLENLIKRLELGGVIVQDKDREITCTACDLAKMVPYPAKGHDKRQRTDVLPGEKWSHDLLGLMAEPAIGFIGGRYCSIAVDYCSGKGDIMIIKVKSQARIHMDLLQKRVDRYHGGARFKQWHTDNARETTGIVQTEANDSKGIIGGKSPAYYHQGNPDAENRMKINE
ncbi:hypothetical protein HDU80_003829, partial [Chytriomyces hyalinus]